MACCLFSLLPMTEALRHPGTLVLLIGPSGVGKSSIINRLVKLHPEWHRARSVTTRAKRPGEAPDAFQFVTDAGFDQLIAAGKLLEWQVVHGGARYGTVVEEILPKLEAGKVVIREIETKGFDAIRNDPRFLRPSGPYKMQSVFILPEHMSELLARIRKRSAMSDAEMERRMASMTHEMTYAPLCDVQVLNGDGKMDQAVKQIEAAIIGE